MGFLGLGSDKVQKTTQTQSTNVDPKTQAYVDQMRNYAQQGAMAAQNYQTQGLNPLQMQAMQQAGQQAPNWQQFGMSPLNPGMVNAQQVGAVQVGPGMQVNAQQVGPVGPAPQVQGPQLGPAAQVNPLAFGNVQAQQVSGGGQYQSYNPQAYKPYMDPYTNEVIDTQRAEYDRMRQGAMTQGAQQATMAGALGNNRGELLQASLLRDINQDQAAQIAQLRSQGFGQAQAAAMGEHALGQQIQQGYAGQNLQGQLANQGANLQAGMFGGQMGMQAQLANQGAQNQFSLANAGYGMQAGLANQGAGLQVMGMNQQGQMANQGANLQAGLANQSMGTQRDLANAGYGMQAGLANQGANLQAGMANQSAGLQAGMANQNFNLGLGGLAMQGYGMNQQGAQNMWNMGAAARDIQQQQSMDPYTRQMMAAGAMGANIGPYGTTSTGTMEQRQKGNLFNDLLNLGSVVSGFIPGAPGSNPGGGGPQGGAQGGYYNPAPMQNAANLYMSGAQMGTQPGWQSQYLPSVSGTRTNPYIMNLGFGRV